MLKHKHITLFCVAVLIISASLFFGLPKEAKAATTIFKSTDYTLAKVKEKKATIFSRAKTTSRKLIRAKKGTQLIKLASSPVKNTSWTKVKFINAKGKSGVGYVKSKLLRQYISKADDTFSYRGKAKSDVKLKKITTDIAKTVRNVKKGEEITVISRLKVGSVWWYKCLYVTKKNKKIKGYARKSDISTTLDIGFELKIKAFPASYKKKLRVIHKSYPKWTFKAVKTGLDWNTVIDNESAVGLNTIQSGYPKGTAFNAPFSYLSTVKGAYDFATDKYTVCDGTNWYSAKSSVIAHYMDPRNSLTPETIFQFQSIKYEGTETIKGIRAILKGTFMSGTYTYTDPTSKKTIKRSYASSFLQAGKRAGISPYFLAARARQECGVSGSKSITGTYPGLKGYYNYYNIGANDSRQGLAIKNGLTFAKSGTTYLRPWNTPYKAILGGAQYISSGYIPYGQVANYFHKFNVVDHTRLYRHQFMSNVQAPTQEAYSNYRSYTEINIIKNKFTFYIPLYKNMPANACALPAVKGNPNAYLSSLNVTDSQGNDLPFATDFSYSTLTYTIEIPKDTEITSINISAKAVSKYSTLTGSGEFTLTNEDSEQFAVNCTSQSGTTNRYLITIVRS